MESMGLPTDYRLDLMNAAISLASSFRVMRFRAMHSACCEVVVQLPPRQPAFPK